MFHVEDSTNFTLRNSKVHNAQNANAMMVFIGAEGPWVFDNNDIYDDRDTTNGGVHTECLRADPLNNVVMTRNHFWACSTMDVFLTGSEKATNWLVENNIFEKPLGPNENAFAFRSGGVPSPSPDGFVFRYNTVASGMQINNADNSPTTRGFTVYGNYFRTGAPCGLPNTTYTYNVAPTGVNCSGTGNRSFSLSSINAGFVSPHVVTSDGPTTEPAGDYTLLPTSPLIDVGSLGAYPALDRLGFARYAGSSPDVGAYEYGGS
jgi:hypothetical protein